MSDPKEAPEIRHRLPDRLFHWAMALAVFVLGATAFLPILGVKFEWVPIHWPAGAVLTIAVVYHIYRVVVVHGLQAMSPGTDDVREMARNLRNAATDDLAPSKYDAMQKGFHAAAAVTILVLLGTGLVMLAKIDTAFWNRNPQILTDQTWGVIYVLHGVASMVILFLVLIHIYFALIPEHRAFLKAMIAGWGPGHARGNHQ